MKKFILPVLALGVVTLTGVSVFADAGGVPMSTKGAGVHKEVIVQALINNDYASLPDAVKAKITEAQFNQAREKYVSKTAKKMNKEVGKDHDKKDEHKKGQGKGMENSMKKGTGPMHSEAVQKAIESGDYAAFREAMIAQIPTEAEFQKRVAAHKAHAVALTAIQTAIKNNDFAAFQKAHTDMKATMSEFHTENGITPKTPDADQMKKHFDEMVAQYKADGTLPTEFGKGEMKKGGEGMDD